jgi:hypothetical protein
VDSLLSKITCVLTFFLPSGGADLYRSWANDLDNSPSLDDGLSNYKDHMIASG